MSGLAARDFEDMLQVPIFAAFSLLLMADASPFKCAIPVFDGLFPEPLNSIVLDVLFVLATFHGLAKLRLSTTSTRAFMRAITSDLGERVRLFQKESEKIPTKELSSEREKRLRRQAKGKKSSREAGAVRPLEGEGVHEGSRQGKTKTDTKGKGKLREAEGRQQGGRGAGGSTSKDRGDTSLSEEQGDKEAEAGGDGPEGRKAGGKKKNHQPKMLNMKTYKFHELGHYVDTILPFGTLDNSNTQWVRSYHSLKLVFCAFH